MSTQDQLNQLEREIKQHEAAIDFATSLNKLRLNRDFIKVISNGYLKDEAIRLVHAKGNPELQSADKQAAVIRDIDAIATLAQFFITVDQKAAIAARQLESAHETRAELAGEDL